MRRDAAQSGTPRRDTAQHGAAHQGATQHSTDQHDTARPNTTRRGTAHHNTPQHQARDANRGSNHNKPPHNPEGTAPARHTRTRGHRMPGTKCGGQPTQAAAGKLKPAPQRRNDTANPGPQEAAWHNRPPAEPEPDPAGRGAQPNVYVTHLTHRAGARPGTPQPPTSNRKITQNADQSVRQHREGRGRNRQTPRPGKKTTGGGGGGENGPKPPQRPPTPQEAAKPPT